MKAFADDRIKVTEELKCMLRMVKHIVGNGENADNQHFLLLTQCFHKVFFLSSLKAEIALGSSLL